MLKARCSERARDHGTPPRLHVHGMDSDLLGNDTLHSGAHCSLGMQFALRDVTGSSSPAIDPGLSTDRLFFFFLTENYRMRTQHSQTYLL